MRNITVSVIVLSACFLAVLVECRKPNNLTMLVFAQFSGNPPKDGILCKAAQQMILDEVNSRSDFLPDYHIIADYQDEGPQGTKAANTAIQFVRRMELARKDGNYQAPLITGVTFTPGCKSLGPIIHHLHSVFIPQACMGPAYTVNRKLYPNMYRTRITTEMGNYAIVQFCKQIGNWKKIALFANADNSYNIAMSLHFHDVAIRGGLQVVRFDVSSGINEALVAQWKESDIRIFVIQVADLPTTFKMLCLCHKNGIKGSKYLFLMQFAVSIDPNTLAPVLVDGCQKAVVIEQFQISFFMGTTTYALEDNGATSVMGLNLPAFEKRFLQYINYTKTSDYEDRFICYDRMLEAVIALNRTENLLKSANKSLRGFADYPVDVMHAINKSVASIEFIGIRDGLLKYDSRLEPDDEPMYVAAWSKEGELKPIIKVVRRPDSDPDDIEAYIIQQNFGLINWTTPNRRPPVDQAAYVVFRDEISQQGINAVASCSGILASIKLLTCVAIFLRQRNRFGERTALSSFVAIGGCIALDAGAALFVLNAGKFGSAICQAQLFLAIGGFSLVHGIFFIRLCFLRRIAHSFQADSMNTVKGVISSRGTGTDGSRVTAGSVRLSLRRPTVHSQISRRSASVFAQTCPCKLTEQQDKAAVILNAALLFVHMSIVIGVFVVHPFEVRRFDLVYHLYDKVADSYFDRYLEICYSEAQFILLLALAGVHVLLLLVSCFFSHALKSVYLANSVDASFRLAVVNEATLFGGGASILLIMTSSPLSQQIIAASFAQIISLTSSVFMIFGIFKTQLSQ